MFTGALMTEKHGQTFTGELKLCSEGGISFGRELFLHRSNFQISLRRLPVVPGRFTACPGTDFAVIFSPGKAPA